MLKRVYLEITNVCNLACSFCPGTNRAKRFMSEEEFSALSEKLRGETQYLYFHLMGEPLLHPLLGRFLTIAEEKGFRVILTTNGTLLPQREETLLAAPALYKVNLSLQSFEANEGGMLIDYVNQCAGFAAEAAAKDSFLERAAASLMKELPALDRESAIELIQRHGTVRKAAKAYLDNVQAKL